MEQIIDRFRESWLTLTDVRKGNNSQKYTMTDGALAAFSVFFTQSPSFLSFQRDMEQKKRNSNARTLFKVEKIPSDQQIRNLLDGSVAGFGGNSLPLEKGRIGGL